MLACLLAAVALVHVVPRHIHAEPSALAEATRGLVRDAGRPMLAYDMAALEEHLGTERTQAFRLGYSGFDRPGGPDELEVAHKLAADIVRAFDDAPVDDAELLRR